MLHLRRVLAPDAEWCAAVPATRFANASLRPALLPKRCTRPVGYMDGSDHGMVLDSQRRSQTTRGRNGNLYPDVEDISPPNEELLTATEPCRA